ncbi:Uncharacterized metal-binding protein YceD, DUF177 family [Pustulibacterium marinum]|uniref:Uncharacterized metal-binding protein YceD, DUF177 family n=1 Tax=Pustulibacterium marinum TaxID=1224947 RepID=A0A1I7EUI2_9FLAO|nr:DUF177 domain-containing protein [Pustulibacterium marinum]SFU27570.1 Uncharacterized metal-binding protein YceD, DUF177 family [Pustulibacterium marinum]
MDKFKEYTIPFVGLKEGKHQFQYQIDNEFFELFDFTEFNSAAVNVDITLNKKSTMLELQFKSKGTVNVDCDLSSEPFDLPIKGEIMLVVKFGEEFNDENEELLIIPHGEHQINVAQYMYEMIVLSVPAKRVHPGIKDGTLSSDILKKLEELQPKEKDKKNNDEDIDPRWNTLKKLLTDK